MPFDKEPEEEAEDMFNEADQDESVDDLTRGTEIYEEDEMEYEEGRDEELDFEPNEYGRGGGLDLFEDDGGYESDFE